MDSKLETRIAIRPTPGLPARKITKIVAYRDGGFGALMPYHEAKSGFLAKIPVNYNQVGSSAMRFDDLVSFTAEDRVKLSYHPDGFAQFSGEIAGRIVSGRNADGTIKGVGVITSPLSSPIHTGPTFAVTAWGIEDFQELPDNGGSITFEQSDFYYRGCTPNSANGWIVEAFVFPARYWAGVRLSETGPVLTMAFRDFEASGAVLKMRVIELPKQDCFIAMFASRVRTSFPAKSGWVLNGPGTRDATGHGYVISAFYPRSNFLAAKAESIDR